MSLDKARYRFLTLLITAAVAMGLLYLGYSQIEDALAYKLPTQKIEFDKIRPPSAREIVDREGRVLDYWYGDKLRFYVPLSQIDRKLVDFVVLSEDAKFFTHGGFDVSEIKNSLEKNFETGKIKRGASTITQQLVKNLFLDKERSLTRKIFEIPWALRVEKDLSKKQILELYLNVIEWGPGIYGAEAASRHFFDKPVANLEIGEALYLSLIIPNPPRFDLIAHPKVKDFIEKKRHDFVNRLVAEKKISADEKALYLASPFFNQDPLGLDRQFPLRHNAAYAGNRNQKAAWLKELEKNLSKIPAAKGKIRLSLDGQLQNDLAEAEAITAQDLERKQVSFVLIKEANHILSFRKLPKELDLSEDYKNLLIEKGYRLEMQSQIPWKSLAL